MTEDGGDGVRSLDRGLRLLQAMNRNPHASVTQLARDINVPRSTAYRLLETLQRLEFVAKASDGGYALTREVRTLSDGFVDEAWIEPAWEEMVRLSSRIIWPVSLFTQEAATMVIRRTTHELSTMSIDYGMSGRRLPITETAAGRVYLAFCSDFERETILAMPAAYLEPPTPISREMLHDRLRSIRERGFDTRTGGVVARTGSLAVPIMTGERILCCISLIYILAGMTAERAVLEFEAPMKAAAEHIKAEAVRLAGGSCAKIAKKR